MRRRPDAARRQAARRHGPDRTSSPATTATTGCGRPAWDASSSWSGPSTRSTRSTATSCAGASSTSSSPPTPSRPGRACSRATRRCARSSSGASCAGRRCSAPTGRADDVRAAFTIVADGANSRFGRALGTFRTREWPYGTAIRTYWQLTQARRAVDRVGARRQGSQRQPDAGLRLDLPGRRRHGEHRRRSAVDVPRLQERQHDPPPRRLRPPDRRPLGDRRRPARGASGERADPDGRIGRAQGRADVPRRRRRRRERQPVQRRGHRLRLRDGAHGRRRAPRGARRRRRHGAAALPEAARRRRTASTSRSPACSPG